jgi:hypothetical protein
VNVNIFSAGDMLSDYSPWVRGYKVWDGITAFIDLMIVDPVVDQVMSPIKVAWLIEPRPLIPHVYSAIERLEDKFNYIITHDRYLLERNPKKYVFASHHKTTIDPRNRFIHPKTRDILFIYSTKGWIEGHKFRLAVADWLRTSRFADRVDVRGAGTGYPHTGYWAGKDNWIKRYRFSIEVENCDYNYNYSEKLIDAFTVGTVPVYRGPNRLEHLFDIRGIIAFRTIGQLELLLDSLTPELYDSMRPYIEHNHQVALQSDDINTWADKEIFQKLTLNPVA